METQRKKKRENIESGGALYQSLWSLTVRIEDNDIIGRHYIFNI